MAQASVRLSVQVILASFICFSTGDGQSGSYFQTTQQHAYYKYLLVIL